jgi:hypothetical protein
MRIQRIQYTFPEYLNAIITTHNINKIFYITQCANTGQLNALPVCFLVLFLIRDLTVNKRTVSYVTVFINNTPA